MSEPFVGQIQIFAGTFAPRGYALCDGQLLQIAGNSALFSIVGTIYGGDGRTTFGLPDLRGRVPYHWGSGPGLPNVNIGQKGGTATTVLNVANLPSHFHAVAPRCNTNGGTSNDPEGNVPNASGARLIYGTPGMNEFMDSTTTSTVGSNTGFDNYPPYQAVNFIIALVGFYPSRA